MHSDLHYAQVSPDGREAPGIGSLGSVKCTPLSSLEGGGKLRTGVP